MAIYHCSMKPVARSGGRSAVAAVAYRTASRLLNERDGMIHDFTAKRGVEHSEIVLPQGVEAEWAGDRATLWNAVERAERRKDARVAREFELALPHELSRDRQIALTRAFAQDLADRYGAAIDFAIHRPTGDTDVRNAHAHVLMTTREVGPNGLGDKTLIERENKWLLNHNQPTSHMQLRDIRQTWENHANRQLMQAGFDIRVDHRSHLERGLEIEPTEHMGVHASQMERRGLGVSRARNEAEAAARNAALIREKPEQVLSLITAEKSVFDRHDVARVLHRYIGDVQEFQNAFATVMASPALVELRPEKDGELARYSTREMVEIEHTMALRASKMGGTQRHGVNAEDVAAALTRQDDAVKAGIAASLQQRVNDGRLSVLERDRHVANAGLSEEQRIAVDHITGPEQITTVIGFAGAGKSTMLAAARDAWERQGYRVHGAALAGKAAEGLEESSGIASRTLASWDYGWQRGRGELGPKDIFVIDEAGMVSSRQLAMFVGEIQAKGAKLVLVGDHEQLQAIGAGSPFRAIVEQVGAVELSEIRRQKQEWQRDASIAFATHRTDEGLEKYTERGDLRFLSDLEAARADLVADYLADLDQRPSGSRIALAHRRADVRAINADIRAALQQKGKLARGEEKHGQDAELGSERIYQTNDGRRPFAPGDRIVLLENNRDLGVKNGMLGTVLAVEPDAIHMRLDGNGLNRTRNVTIPVKSYQAFDHGYATTIHKSQGATVDRSFVMASATMDRHLTYVAMTRHRDQVRLYVGQDELKDLKALSANLGRSGAKETTLDYTNTFAARRGFTETFGVHSEIAIGLSGQHDSKPVAHHNAMGERAGSQADRPPSIGLEAAAGGPKFTDEEIAPLVPALTQHSRSVDDIAHEKARPDLEQAMEVVRQQAQHVFVDPDRISAKFTATILHQKTDARSLARSVAEKPEEFGELRGKSGIFGDNAERKAARFYAKGLGHHIASAADTWSRRRTEERDSETWSREKQDVVEVPGLSSRSERILREFDALAQVDKKAFLERIAGTQEGQKALKEVETVSKALQQRFGSADPGQLSKQSLRLGPDVAATIDRITDVARIVDRAERAEVWRQYELKRSLGKRLGLGLRM
ncbi:Ti-type conjugative transfer relaxase TraA [Rhizobiaceae bacterium n13]|uniref:Ti-type conjugative transfer relaxase TraA n=1 Tax=Ferirhizobium litorale TaxID=2927786 RepID=UPI0024B30311|nr:Ti-type conjugative transfer relaxase TraA [Fererhizobium litorale]MDI7862378.1 Ti-type conjugative transfer relaxase TraA [Fererhizobium litorale]